MICTKCKQEKDQESFHYRNEEAGYRHKICRVCTKEHTIKYYNENREKVLRDTSDYYNKNKGKMTEYKAKWFKENQDRIRLERNLEKDIYHNRCRQLKRDYGITEEDVRFMMDIQKGICLICQGSLDRHGKGYFIDHCHTTGLVRGLLCGYCNSAIGFFQDDIGSLKRAVEYLIISRS